MRGCHTNQSQPHFSIMLKSSCHCFPVNTRYECGSGFRTGLMVLTVSMGKDLVAIDMLSLTTTGQQERPHVNPNPHPRLSLSPLRVRVKG